MRGQPVRVAAIDCGTNTIKLLVLDEDGADLEREMRIVRLGQDVDRTGRLAEEALERTFAAVEEYADLVARHGVDRVRFCATSATRGMSITSRPGLPTTSPNNRRVLGRIAAA